MARYFVDGKGPGDEVTRAFSALLDLRRRDLVMATIDAITCRQALPDQAAAALERLTALAHATHRGPIRRLVGIGDPLMGVALDLRKDDDLELVRAFGPFSIHVSVHGEERNPIATIDDCGAALLFDAGAHLVAQLERRAELPPGAIRELPR